MVECLQVHLQVLKENREKVVMESLGRKGEEKNWRRGLFLQFNKIREEIHLLLNRSKTSYSPTVSLRGVSFEIILAFCLWISFISGIQYTLECLQSNSQSPNKITSILPLGKI